MPSGRLRALGGAIGAGALALVAPASPQAKTLGFVFSYWGHAAYDNEAADCPLGLNQSPLQVVLSRLPAGERARLEKLENRPELMQRAGLADKSHTPCTHPRDFADSGHKTVEGPIAFGMDLDGDVTGSASANTCQHQNFTGADGSQGVDNQWWRAMGCIKYYRPGHIISQYNAMNIRQGQVSILLELTGVDDVRNDPEVEIGLYSSQDGVTTDAPGAVLSGASLAVTDNTRFHSRARGRIENGVLHTDPFETRLKYKAVIMDTEWYFKDARLRLDLKPDGSAEGMLAGYYDLATFWDLIRQSTWSPSVLGWYTCQGVYNTIHRIADGHPDPATGQCTSLSAAFRIEAVPAFVIHPKVQVAKEQVATAADAQAAGGLRGWIERLTR